MVSQRNKPAPTPARPPPPMQAASTPPPRPSPPTSVRLETREQNILDFGGIVEPEIGATRPHAPNVAREPSFDLLGEFSAPKPMPDLISNLFCLHIFLHYIGLNLFFFVYRQYSKSGSWNWWHFQFDSCRRSNRCNGKPWSRFCQFRCNSSGSADFRRFGPLFQCDQRATLAVEFEQQRKWFCISRT